MTDSKRWIGISLLLGACVGAAGPAWAHTGLDIGGGLAAGFMHPFLGADHLLAMLTVGALAATAAAGNRALWALPLSFMVIMALGGALGLARLPLPAVEQGIALSLVVFGALLATRIGLPVPAAMAIIGLFALFHGHAHGAELPEFASPVGYVAGFVAATGLLHLAGIVVARTLARFESSRISVLRLAGGAVAASGVALLIV